MNTKRLFRDLIKVLCIALLASCSGDRASLNEAETLLETDPKSADSILTSMPVPHSRRDRAWYAVLKTQAVYKQYKAITSDSLILSATNFYGTHHKNYRASMAWYTQGCVYTELHDDVSAIESYLKAQDLFPDTLIRYYALTEQNLTKLYIKHHYYDLARTTVNSMIYYGENSSDSTILFFGKYFKGTIFLHEQQSDSAETLFKEIVDSKWLIGYCKQETLLKLSIISVNFKQDYESALVYTRRFIDNNPPSNCGTAYQIRGDAFKGLGVLDSAEYYYKMCLNCELKDPHTICDAYRGLSEVASYNSPDSAKIYTNLSNQWLDSIYVEHKQTEVMDALVSNYANNHKKTHIMLSLMVLVILLFIIWFTCFQIIKRKQKSIENSMVLKKEQDIGSLLYKAKENLNKTSSYIAFLSINKNKPISSTILANLHADSDLAFHELRNVVASKNIQLSKREFDLCVFSYMGISSNIIAELLEVTPVNLRTVRKRVRMKLPTDIFKMFFISNSR